ncbi:hypothetical protein Tco_1060004 [Tanacetum coccineum]
MIENDKLNGSNFIDWHKNLRLTVKYEGKLHRIYSPVPNPYAPNATSEQEMENRVVLDMIDDFKNIFQTQANQELYNTQRHLNACKMEESQPVSSHVLKMKSYTNNLEHLGYPMPHRTTRDVENFQEERAFQECRSKFQYDQIGHLKRNCPSYLVELKQVAGDWKMGHETVACILNMVSTNKVEKTPYEMWHGKVFKLSFLKLWGCDVLVKHSTPKKLETCSIKLQAPPKNQENNIALAAPILRRLSMPYYPGERYSGYLIDSKAHDLRDYEEHETYCKAMTGSKSDQ